MDLEAFRWLLTGPGQALLGRAAEVCAAHPDDPVRASSALRSEASGPRVAAALTQARLRDRGRRKLGVDAARMYFTSEGLEQATRRRVATHRASRVALMEPTSVLDLGCGIGGDLLALSRAGLTVAGVDRDPLRVEVARANLDALGLPGAVRVASAADVDVSPFAMVFADPARRTSHGRVFDVHGWSPPWDLVQSLLTGSACVKVAPGIPHRLLPDGVEAEWVSERGEVTEASLWSPRLATARRRATVIAAAGLTTVTDTDPSSAEVRPVGRFLFEPDGAVVRAGLVGAVAGRVGGGLLDGHIAYVSGPDPVRTALARGYEVLDRLPYREKQLRAALRALDVGRLTIKKRGVDVVPETLRSRLAAAGALSGSGEATLVLTRVRGHGAALLVRPL